MPQRLTSFSLNNHKVIKTGPDRSVQPVRPGTGKLSGSVYQQNRSANEPDIKPVNRIKTGGSPVKTGSTTTIILNFFFL
jgi:hypothetical protein